jgi:hypothetical protein
VKDDPFIWLGRDRCLDSPTSLYSVGFNFHASDRTHSLGLSLHSFIISATSMLFSLSFLSTSSSREKKAEEVSFTSDLKGDKGLVLEFDHDFVPHPSLPPEASQ